MKNSSIDEDMVHAEAYLEEDDSLEEILEDSEEYDIDDEEFELNEETIREIASLLEEREVLTDTEFDFDLLD